MFTELQRRAEPPVSQAAPGAASQAASNPWRRYRRRPVVVGLPGFVLTLLGCLSIGGAPFLLILEQINAGPSSAREPLPWMLLGAQVGVSLVLILLGACILRGRNWARWVYAFFGLGVVGAVAVFFSPLYAVPGLALYLALLVPLFRRRATHFFGE